LNGRPGRAKALIAALQTESLVVTGKELYNSLEAPALDKFPILALYQEFLLSHGAEAALMSGSGSTTFALLPSRTIAESAAEKFREPIWPGRLVGDCSSLTWPRRPVAPACILVQRCVISFTPAITSASASRRRMVNGASRRCRVPRPPIHPPVRQVPTTRFPSARCAGLFKCPSKPAAS